MRRTFSLAWSFGCRPWRRMASRSLHTGYSSECIASPPTCHDVLRRARDMMRKGGCRLVSYFFKSMEKKKNIWRERHKAFGPASLGAHTPLVSAHTGRVWAADGRRGGGPGTCHPAEAGPRGGDVAHARGAADRRAALGLRAASARAAVPRARDPREPLRTVARPRQCGACFPLTLPSRAVALLPCPAVHPGCPPTQLSPDMINVTVNVGFNTKMAVEEILEYVARAGPGGSDACARSRLRAHAHSRVDAPCAAATSQRELVQAAERKRRPARGEPPTQGALRRYCRKGR